jgi:hypothetical protein
LAPVLACAALATVFAGADARPRHGARALARPVLVELFTAQGCEGCPQADLALGELAKRKGVIALTFSVDIWDYTGWTDTLAQPEFTARQQAYVKRLKVREIYTPEVVVDGAGEAAGLDPKSLAPALQRAAAESPRGPTIRLSKAGDRVWIGAEKVPARALDVWLIRYDPKAREVKVKAGDNKGKTVVVTNAVRELARIGGWRGRPVALDLPDATAEGLKTVIVVQGPHGGIVTAAARD